ncbi:PREDICTED: ankyrin repeat-containing protein At5g02620-like [Nicotiana attenuata]|uniref:ankyrin repeat-containing protein At5g02620-like n=1 Tax=Nicotiana attenuata TaxID=49451 RepID=UPI00090520A7|nr:PREDICTED: ankyrin repeat-containing protein At5g02620-like [Nicotiana attenuata]
MDGAEKQRLIRMIDENGDTALHMAARGGLIGVVKFIMKEDPEFELSANNAGETPLYLAVEKGLVECSRAILESCKKPTYDGPCSRTPLHAAIIRQHTATEGDINMINELLKHCPDCWETLNSCGQNVLHISILNKQEEVVKYFLDSGKWDSLVNEADNDGNTPLHLVAASGNYVPELIKHPKVTKMSVNKENQTPLDLALVCTESTNKMKIGEIGGKFA